MKKLLLFSLLCASTQMHGMELYQTLKTNIQTIIVRYRKRCENYYKFKQKQLENSHKRELLEERVTVCQEKQQFLEKKKQLENLKSLRMLALEIDNEKEIFNPLTQEEKQRILDKIDNDEIESLKMDKSTSRSTRKLKNSLIGLAKECIFYKISETMYVKCNHPDYAHGFRYWLRDDDKRPYCYHPKNTKVPDRMSIPGVYVSIPFEAQVGITTKRYTDMCHFCFEHSYKSSEDETPCMDCFKYVKNRLMQDYKRFEKASRRLQEIDEELKKIREIK